MAAVTRALNASAAGVSLQAISFHSDAAIQQVENIQSGVGLPLQYEVHIPTPGLFQIFDQYPSLGSFLTSRLMPHSFAEAWSNNAQSTEPSSDAPEA